MSIRTVIVLLMTFAATARAVGGEIVIVKSSEAEPYSQAEQGLRSRLEEQKFTVRVLLLKDVADKGVAKAVGSPDAVVAIGSASAIWLHDKLPPASPLVYCMVANPAGAGLTAGKATVGVTTDVSVASQLQLLAETLPDVHAIGMLYRSDKADARDVIAAAERALPAGVRLEAVAVNDFPNLAAAIDALTRKPIGAIWTTGDTSVYDAAAVRALLLSALRAKIPVWGFSPAFVRAGAIVGIGVDPRAQGTQAAAIAARLAADHNAAMDRVQYPESYQIAVNLIVAEQLGIEIPKAVVGRAQFVFRGSK